MNSSIEVSISLDLRVLRKVEREGVCPGIVEGIIAIRASSSGSLSRGGVAGRVVANGGYVVQRFVDLTL